MGHWFYVSKNDFENLKKLWSILIFLIFLNKNLMSNQRPSPFLNNPPSSQTLLFLEKIFHSHSSCKFEGFELCSCHIDESCR